MAKKECRRRRCGEPGVGQQRAVAEDLVEDIRLLKVIQLFGRADKRRHWELLAGQQLEEGLERNQRRHPCHAPAGAGLQHLVDLAELRNTLMGQAELLDAVQVLLAGTPFNHLELAGDQGIPHLMLSFRVMDKATVIRFTRQVLRALHHCLLLGLCCCIGLRNTPARAVMQPWVGSGKGEKGSYCVKNWLRERRCGELSSCCCANLSHILDG